MKQRPLVQFPIARNVRDVLANILNTFYVLCYSEWRNSLINLVLGTHLYFVRDKSQRYRRINITFKSTIKETLGISFVNFLFADINPCSLLCRRGSRVVPFGTVIDGTRCSLNAKIKDVCIEGKCRVSYSKFVWINNHFPFIRRKHEFMTSS